MVLNTTALGARETFSGKNGIAAPARAVIFTLSEIPHSCQAVP